MPTTEVISNRKQEIIEKATALFQKQGYSATSMRDLASFIGMEAASLYSHIKSKEDVEISEAFELYMLKNFMEIKLDSLSEKTLSYWEKDFNLYTRNHS